MARKENTNSIKCTRCGRNFSRKDNLLRHIKNHHESYEIDNSEKFVKKKYFKCGDCNYYTYHESNLIRHEKFCRKGVAKKKLCEICGYQTKSRFVLLRHQIQAHSSENEITYPCRICRLMFEDMSGLKHHIENHHPKDNAFKISQKCWKDPKNSVSRYMVYKKSIREPASDASCLWNEYRDFRKVCQRLLAESFEVIQFYIVLPCCFIKEAPDEEDVIDIFHIATTSFTAKPHTKYRRLWGTIIKQLDEGIENHLMVGSGWTLKEVMSVEIHVMKIESLKLNCNKQRFSPQLALQGVRGKKHLVNVANSPFNCFLSCLAYYYLKKSCGVAVKQNLEDAAENFEAYKQFIYSLDYSETKIEQPYDKPVSIKDMKIILAKNIKILGHIKVNLFGLVTMWRKAKIYAHELNMGNKRDECKFFFLLNVF